MAAALKSIGHRAATLAILVALERIIPALAAGLVAMAHELHADAAKAEAARRA